MKTFVEFTEQMKQFSTPPSSPGGPQAWHVRKTTERYIYPAIERTGIKEMPIEIKVVAVDAILEYLGVKMSDLQQHSNQ